MEDIVHKNKSYEAPSVSPYTLRAVAIGHYLFASFTFVALAIGNVVDGSGIDKNLADAVAGIDSPQAQTMRRKLERTGDFKDGLKRHLQSRLPANAWIDPTNQVLNVGLAVLLLAAGSCLSQRRPLGQTLSFIFAGVCLAQQIGTMAWQQLYEVPIAKDYLEQMIRLYPNDGELIRGILLPLTNGPTFHLLIAVYPICVLAIMVQPGVKELLRPTARAADYPVEMPSSHRLSPAQVHGSIPDPLEELLKRKTF